MDNEELEEKLDIIFDKEYFDEDGLEMRYRYEPPGGPKNSSFIDRFEPMIISPLLISNPLNYELHFPSHKLLMSLFNQISNNEINSKFFIDYMLRKISSPRKDSDLILAFDTLFRLDYITYAFTVFYTRYQNILKVKNTKNFATIVLRSKYVYVSLINWLEDIIRYEYNRISVKNLDLIEQNIKRLVKINTSLEHRLKKYGKEIKVE
jgi:hypothetical protein